MNKVKQLEQCHIGAKHTFGFGYFAKLAVKGFNDVGGVNNSSYLFGIFEVIAEPFSVCKPTFYHGWILCFPCFFYFV
jgi:hypothetical protein